MRHVQPGRPAYAYARRTEGLGRWGTCAFGSAYWRRHDTRLGARLHAWWLNRRHPGEPGYTQPATPRRRP